MFVQWLLMLILSLARFRVCRCSAFGDSRLALWSLCSSFHCCPQFAWLGSGILQLSVLRRTSSDPRTLQRPHLFATDRLARFRNLATYSLAAASLGVHTMPGSVQDVHRPLNDRTVTISPGVHTQLLARFGIGENRALTASQNCFFEAL